LIVSRSGGVEVEGGFAGDEGAGGGCRKGKELGEIEDMRWMAKLTDWVGDRPAKGTIGEGAVVVVEVSTDSRLAGFWAGGSRLLVKMGIRRSAEADRDSKDVRADTDTLGSVRMLHR